VSRQLVGDTGDVDVQRVERKQMPLLIENTSIAA